MTQNRDSRTQQFAGGRQTPDPDMAGRSAGYAHTRLLEDGDKSPGPYTVSMPSRKVEVTDVVRPSTEVGHDPYGFHVYVGDVAPDSGSGQPIKVRFGEDQVIG
jgi:hypothetical protein